MSNKTSKNDITGASIKSVPVSKLYKDNYDLIFSKDKKELEKNKKENIVCSNINNNGENKK